MRRLVLAALVALWGASAAFAGDIVVPVIAWDAPGSYNNLWSTEVYLINPTSQDLQVILPKPLPLRMTVIHPCDPPVHPWTVPAQSSLLVSASELNTVIGCPGTYVGGLVFSSVAPGLAVATRMTNHKATGLAPDTGLLAGFSQEVPGIATSNLPSPGGEYMLPALTWHQFPCGPTAFDTYVYFANPNNTDATVTLVPPSGKTMSLMIGGAQVDLPYTVTVPANRDVQLALQPLNAGPVICSPPSLFDLFFEVSEPVAVLGSVVDRASNDARTVLPIAVVQ